MAGTSDDTIRVGDLCEIVDDVDHNPKNYIGLECTVIGGLALRPNYASKQYLDVPRFLVYVPQIIGTLSATGRLAALPCELRKKKPPSWEQCAWQPREMEAA